MIIRNEEEREILREGGARHAIILQTLKSLVKPGVSTADLEKEARRLVAEGGDEAAFLGYTPHETPRAYPAALCVSINEAVVHGIPNEDVRILADGDVVTLDIGLKHRGLITDAAITVIAGKPQGKDVELVRATEEALAAGIAEARTGNTLGDVGAAIDAVAKRHGFGSPKELGGHGVGKSVHELPFVYNYGKPGKGPVLEEGQVMAIEPMLTHGSGAVRLLPDDYTYVTSDGARAAHVEHTIIVGADGAEVLTG